MLAETKFIHERNTFNVSYSANECDTLNNSDIVDFNYASLVTNVAKVSSTITASFTALPAHTLNELS